MKCAAGSSPGAQQRAVTGGGVTCTSSSSSEMAQLDDVCLSPGYFVAVHSSTYWSEHARTVYTMGHKNVPLYFGP